MNTLFKHLSKSIWLLAFILINACAVNSKVNTIEEKAPWGNEEFTYPDIGNKDYSITSYGAQSIAEYNNQEAIQKAIDECNSKGGGKVIVPEGTWETSYITLKSNVNLHLEEGAILSFYDDLELYNTPTFTRWEGIECMNYHPLIYANEAHDIALTGKGKIKGNGEKLWGLKKIQRETLDKLYTQVLNDVPPTERNCLDYEGGSYLRPSLIQFVNSKNILVDGIEIGSGPMWTLHFIYSENIIAQNIDIITEGTNNDGIVLDSSKKILIDNCFFSTGDDCIVIKSGLNEDGWRVNKPSERIIVKNCKTKYGHGGVVVGSEMSGGVKNIYAHDCDFSNTERGLRIKSMKGRGGYVKDIWFENIRMDSIRNEAIKINMKYGSSSIEPRNDKVPVYSNINIKDITSSNSKICINIIGLEEQKIDFLTFENLTMHGKNGILISNAEDIKFDNIKVEADENEPVQMTDCGNVTFNNVKFVADTESMIKLSGKNFNVEVNNSNEEDFDSLFDNEESLK